jgi:hypothetical protein
MYGTADFHRPCTPFVKNASEMHGFTEGCLPMRRWDELNSFFKKSRWVQYFSLRKTQNPLLLLPL